MIRFFSALLLLSVVFGSYLAFTDINSEPNVVETEPEPEEWVMDDALAMYLEEFEQDFEEGLNGKQIPGAAVAIVKDGRVVFQKWRKRERKARKSR